MTVAKLISILEVLPMDSVIQLQYYTDSYEPPYTGDVKKVAFIEKETFEKYPESNRPNRVILS